MDKMDKMVELLERLVGMNQSSNTTPQLYPHIQPNYLPYPPNLCIKIFLVMTNTIKYANKYVYYQIQLYYYTGLIEILCNHRLPHHISGMCIGIGRFNYIILFGSNICLQL